MAISHLLLGSNIGIREENLKKAILHLKEIGVKILRESSIYETEPWGFSDQPSFYNQALEVETSFFPEDLLNEVKNIEKLIGRECFGRWKERLIDIDIIYYENQVYKSNNLTVPHPEMQFRKFVLLPLSEIAPDFIHPIFNLSTRQLLDRCEDDLEVTKITS